MNQQDLAPRIIDLPVEENQNDPEFQIQRMWLEATPYIPGENCLFFAVQGAMIHFSEKALTENDLKGYKSEITKAEDRLRLSSPVKGAGQLSSMDMIARKLEPEKIVPEKIMIAEESVETARTYPATSRFSDIIEPVAPGEKVKFPFPCIVITKRTDNTSHVFFAPNKKIFYDERDEEMAPGDKVTMIVKLRKAESPTEEK